MRRTSGRRRSFAICSAWTCFSWIAASAAPPRTVKSSAAIAIGRPWTRARPKMKLDGEDRSRSPSSPQFPTPAILPSSLKLAGSSNRSTRSRTVSLPLLFWSATFSAPPISRATRWRSRSSAISGSQISSLTVRLLRSFDGREQLTFRDVLAGFDVDRRHAARNRRLDGDLHLHDFESKEDLGYRDPVSCDDVDRRYHSLSVGLQ